VLSVGLGLYFGVFVGRKWVLLYNDHLEIQGPVANLLRRAIGASLWTDVIRYRDIIALGRWMYEPRGGSYLIIQQSRERKAERFRVGFGPIDKYLEFKAELLKRIPANCELYSSKGFSKRYPW
jgi:hypothetical protein